MELFQYIFIYLLHQLLQPLGRLHFQNKIYKKIKALKLILINELPTSPPLMCNSAKIFQLSRIKLDNSCQRMLRRYGLNGKLKTITKYVPDIDIILPKKF